MDSDEAYAAHEIRFERWCLRRKVNHRASQSMIAKYLAELAARGLCSGSLPHVLSALGRAYRVRDLMFDTKHQKIQAVMRPLREAERSLSRRNYTSRPITVFSPRVTRVRTIVKIAL